MSSDEPPRACLADFGFMTMVLDPRHPMSCSAQLEGGTITFMSPELLVPSIFGVKNATPTPEADIYAFGLVIFQVREEHDGYLLLAYLSRSLRVKSHSAVFERRSWDSFWSRGSAQTNRQMP